jgi:potassium inwardly-rectifying channel subfamily J
LRDDNFILGTKISVKMLRTRITVEGEQMTEMQNISVNPETATESCIFFVWPIDIVHIIDEHSPFYDLSAADLGKKRFELVIVLEGTNETSNMTFQSRSSYLPSEIKWGKRFEKMLLYRKDQNKHQVSPVPHYTLRPR